MLLSVIIPCYNEVAVLREAYRQLTAALDQLRPLEYELIYVDDGSRDETVEVIRQLQSEAGQVRAVLLSRNFGHQVAVTAGLEHASGEAAIVIDADLQDPPEVILEMVARWRDGYQVVYGVRTERSGEKAFKRWTAKVFYRLLNRLSRVHIPIDAGDFRLMDRSVVDALLAMPERDRFLRGMVSWAGFRQVAVFYQRAPRLAGTSKYPLLKMINLALDGVISFSYLPLRLSVWTGFIIIGLIIILIFYALVARLYTNDWVRGWASLFIAVLFMGGVQLIFLGIIGEYIVRIYGEVKQRPLYFVQDLIGFRADAVHPPAASSWRGVGRPSVNTRLAAQHLILRAEGQPGD
ncbi:MAG: glycosyltransferase family 2 protein, partial [Pyrinomonadaceae bacterium]